MLNEHSWNSTMYNPTFRHQWTIDNFGNLLNEQSLSTVHSEKFPPKCSEFQFSLRLLPNYVERYNNTTNQSNQSFVSIFLHLENCTENIILNTKYRISFVDQDYAKGRSTFTKGNCHGFATFIQVTTLKQFLHQFGDKLCIICDVELENYQQISSYKILHPHSSNTFKVNHSKAIKFSCKWTLYHVMLFYYKHLDHDKVSLKFENYSVPGKKNSSFYLVLEMTKDDKQQQQKPNDDENVFKKNISLFLYYESDCKQEVMVNYRMSIFNWKDQPYVTGEGQGKMLSKGNGRGAANFISCDDLLDLRKGLLSKDKLVIFVQIEIFDSEFENKLAKVIRNVKSFVPFDQINFDLIFKRKVTLNDELIRLWDKRFITSWGKKSLVYSQCQSSKDITSNLQEIEKKKLRQFKFGQFWTIENYSHFYFDDHQSPTWIQSGPFPTKQAKDETQFCLRFNPNLADDNERKFISIFVHLLSGPDIHVECKLSIIDYRKNVCNTKTIKGFLTTDKELSLEEFVSNDSAFLLKNGYLPGNLTISCQIEILEYLEDDKEIEEESVETNESNYSEIDIPHQIWDASRDVIKYLHQWCIPQYRLIHQLNVSLSDNFSIENFASSKYYLYLWPKGESRNGDHLSLYMNNFDREYEEILLSLSILDYQSKFRNTKWICERLSRLKNIGCERFIENDYLFEQEHELLPDNNLTINCQMEVLRRVENKIKFSMEEMEKQTSSNHLVMDSIQSMNITNSIVLFDSNSTFNGNVTLIHKEL